MAGEVFIDTSGFHSLLVRSDRTHDRAARFMARAARDRARFITTDYVLDWLRAGNDHLALVTNGGQGRLVFAGLDHEAWCEWDLRVAEEPAGYRAISLPQDPQPDLFE